MYAEACVSVAAGRVASEVTEGEGVYAGQGEVVYEGGYSLDSAGYLLPPTPQDPRRGLGLVSHGPAIRYPSQVPPSRRQSVLPLPSVAGTTVRLQQLFLQQQGSAPCPQLVLPHFAQPTSGFTQGSKVDVLLLHSEQTPAELHLMATKNVNRAARAVGQLGRGEAGAGQGASKRADEGEGRRR